MWVDTHDKRPAMIDISKSLCGFKNPHAFNLRSSLPIQKMFEMRGSQDKPKDVMPLQFSWTTFPSVEVTRVFPLCVNGSPITVSHTSQLDSKEYIDDVSDHRH